MAANTSIPRAISSWSREALGAEKGTRLLFLASDAGGRARDLFLSLRSQMRGKGLRVMDVASHNGSSGPSILGLGDREPGAGPEPEDHDFQRHREQLLGVLRRGLEGLASGGSRPLVLFVEDLERCDDHTKLLIEMLLDSGHDYPFPDDPGLRAIVVALGHRGPTAEALSRHPAVLCWEPESAPVSRPARRLEASVIRAIRALQIADLPLLASEVEHVAGRGVMDALRRESVALDVKGRGPTALYSITDPRPAGLPPLASLPEAEIRRHHERLLEIFEGRSDDQSCAVARLRHAAGAWSAEAVVRYWQGAIDALLESHRRSEACELLTAGLSTLAGREDLLDEAIRLRRRLARLEAGMGRPIDAAAAIQAVPRARRSGEDDLLLARCLLGAGRPNEVHEAVREATSTTRDAHLALQLRGVLAEAEYVRGNLDEAARLCRDLAASTDLPEDDRARARNTLGKVYLARGRYDEAERIFRDNLAKARAAGEARHAAISGINAAVARMRLHHYSSARKLLVEALREAVESGCYREEAIARENLATVHHMLRDYAEAMEHYRSAFALLRYLGNPEYLARIANNLGEIYLRFGDVDRAAATRAYALDAAAEHPVSRVEAEGLLLEGRIKFMRGDTCSAAEAFEQAARVFAGLEDTPHRVEALVWNALACIELRRIDDARRLLDQARPLAADERMAARVHLAAGMIERLNGGEYESALSEALELMRRTGDLEGELEALHALAEAELDRGDAVFARRHLSRAREIDQVIRARVPEAFHASYDAMLSRRRLATTESRARSLDRETGDEARKLLREDRSRTQSPTPKIVGESEPMQVVYRTIHRVAKLQDLVLIEGESGTGKELAAEAIHAQSPRAAGPLIKINCASFVENLLQSELFGHERGAFTGAVRRRRGWFETASGGTLFLDEIGDIPPATQVNLLRVLQDKVIYRVGGREPIEVDVRIIAATNRDLRIEVAEGRFRKDLFYRLQGLRVLMPALRERTGDVRLLVEHILDNLCTEFRLQRTRTHLSEGAVRLLEGLTWPGNVRELENVVRSAVLFADGRTVTQRDLVPYIETQNGNRPAERAVLVREGQAASGPGSQVDLGQVLLGAVSLPQFKKEIERRCISGAIAQCKGNITKAAAILGMKRPRLSQLVKYYGVDKDASGAEES